MRKWSIQSVSFIGMLTLLVILFISHSNAGSVGPIKSSSLMIFHSEKDYIPYTYTAQGQASGVLDGFHANLTRLVCEAMRQDCLITAASPSECITSTQDLGPGVVNRYYRGCVGWFRTVTRINMLHSVPFTQVINGAFFQSKLIPHLFDGVSFQADTVLATVSSWAWSHGCIRRVFNGLSAPVQVEFPVESAIDALVEGRSGVNLLFISEEYESAILARSADIERLPVAPVQCQLGGQGVIARLDDPEPIEMWNQGFAKVVESGKYAQLCQAFPGVKCV